MILRFRDALSWFVLSCALAAGPPLHAKRAALKPDKRAQIKRINQDYVQCRKDAVAEFKEKSPNTEILKQRVATCREKFPSASAYVDCKVKTIKNAKSKKIDNKAVKEALRKCIDELLANAFDPHNPFPWNIDKGKMSFSGIGLNAPLPMPALSLPNYDCSRILAASKTSKVADYLLVGNHPRHFGNLGALGKKEFLKTLGIKLSKKPPTFYSPAGMGRIFGDPTKAEAAVFFPAAYCNFDSDLGKIYSGLKIYYLIDYTNHEAVPFFAVAFYAADPPTDTNKLVRRLVDNLGGTFVVTEKADDLRLVSSVGIAEFDDEGDPRNLCAKNQAGAREHQFLGVIKGKSELPKVAEYLLLANIKNLCDYGDRLAARLTKSK